MATIIYPTLKRFPLTIGASTYNYVADLKRGATVPPARASTTKGTTSGGTWISTGFYFCTPAVSSFVLASQISFNAWGDESNGQANASIGVKIYYYTLSSGLSAEIIQLSSTTELLTSSSAVTATGTPSATSIPSDANLILEWGFVNIGTMGGSRLATLNFDGSVSGELGDTYVTFSENINFKNRIRVHG